LARWRFLFVYLLRQARGYGVQARAGHVLIAPNVGAVNPPLMPPVG
jgi:hypothetical protein